MGQETLGVQAVDDLDAGRMVGDAEVFVTERLRRPRHLEHGRPAVAPISVRVEVALVRGQVDDRLVIARGLSRLRAKPFEIGAASVLDQPGEHLGDAGADAFDGGELVGLVQCIEVWPFEREPPRRRREGPRPVDLLGVLSQEIADLG